MNDQDKTKDQLISELTALRKQLAALEHEPDRPRTREDDFVPTNSSWHSLVANTPLFILVLDRDHHIRFINHSQPSETPGHVIGKTPYDYCLPEQRSTARDKIDWVFANGEPASYEVQAVHPNIGNVWYQAHLGPIFESGKVTAVSMIAVDITTRKQAEQESDRTHAVLNAAIDCLPFEFFAIDTDGCYMLANAVARIRYPDIIGKTPEEMCPNQEDLVVWLDNNRRAFAGERVAGEIKSTASGEERHCYNVVTPIRDGDEFYGILGVNMDITDRVRAEKALRESEQRYRLLTELIPQPVWRCNADGAIVECNCRWYEYTGQTPEEAQGDGWMKALHPDDIARVAERVKTSIAGGEPHQIEYRLRRASDGSYRWHLAKAIPIKDKDGTIRDWFGSVAEIHDQKEVQTELEKGVEERTGELTKANRQLHREVEERRRAEESLRQSHEQLQTIYDGIIEGLLITDIETKRIRRVNSSFCRMLGYGEEELLTKSLSDLHPAEEVPNDVRRFEAAAEGLVSINEDRPVLRKDGSLFYADITAHRIVFEGRPCLLALLRDVTERREWAEALRRSEDRYRNVVEGQTEVISRFKADGTLTFVNEVYCRFFGKESQELLDRKWHPVAHPEDLPIIKQKMRAISPDNPIVVIENRVYSHEGEVRWMQFVNRGFFDQAGRLTEVQSIGRDITERKQAQEALQRERRTLEHMLRASDHERQLIAYDIHDGLAQQLAAAIMQFQTYEKTKNQDAGKAKTTFASGVALVQRALTEARRLISGVRPPVLDEAGVAVAIAHLVHETREPDCPQIEYHDDVKFGRLRPILENAIYRIAQEAIANACQHSRTKKVKVSLIQNGSQLHLQVQDWGVGLPPGAVPENCFGLDGIKERTRLLGGEVVIESEPGKGTCIRVTLPLLEPV